MACKSARRSRSQRSTCCRMAHRSSRRARADAALLPSWLLSHRRGMIAAGRGLTGCARSNRRDRMPGLMLIEAGRLVDGTGARPTESARMIVEDGRIREVGPASQVRSPQGDAERLDFSDFTVMPGLIDGHVHL